MARKMPRQKPGKSETVVRTPPEFLQAVLNYLNVSPQFSCDLAALKNNAVCSTYITPSVDSLAQKWEDYSGWCWLNPPYNNIRLWVKKAREAQRKGAKIAVLVPASIGAKWWRKWVFRKAHVLIVGRLNFLDKNGNPIVSPTTGKPTPYPKDLALLLYGGSEPGIEYFDWKEWI